MRVNDASSVSRLRENDRKLTDKLLFFAWHSPHTHLIVGPNDFLAMEKKVWVNDASSVMRKQIMTEKMTELPFFMLISGLPNVLFPRTSEFGHVLCGGDSGSYQAEFGGL